MILLRIDLCPSQTVTISPACLSLSQAKGETPILFGTNSFGSRNSAVIHTSFPLIDKKLLLSLLNNIMIYFSRSLILLCIAISTFFIGMPNIFPHSPSLSGWRRTTRRTLTTARTPAPGSARSPAPAAPTSTRRPTGWEPPLGYQNIEEKKLRLNLNSRLGSKSLVVQMFMLKCHEC